MKIFNSAKQPKRLKTEDLLRGIWWSQLSIMHDMDNLDAES